MPFEPAPGDHEKLQRWPMVKDPFAAVKDASRLKTAARWLKSSHRRKHKEYHRQRAEWIQQHNFEKYFAEADRTIPRHKWEYLKLRKSWYQMPLGWEHFTRPDARRILDLGCGDGDFTQRVVDYVAAEWKRTGTGHPLHIVGIDLSPSRIRNAQDLVRSPDPRITVEFQVGDAKKPLPFADRHFDFTTNTGVLEILEDEPARHFTNEMCRVTRQGIYIEDLLDRYPGGYPREDLNELLRPAGFEVKKREVVLTEPFALFEDPDPCLLWPVLRDQNVWAERVGK